MNKIIIPNVNNNETEAELVSWLANDGDYIEKGDLIASLLTTKADVDIESEFSGYIKIVGKINHVYNVGDVIAYISENNDDLSEVNDESENLIEKFDKPYTITKPAQEFIKKYNISVEKIDNLGLSLIKVKDLEKLVDNTDPDLIEFDPIQKTIASNVSLSHKEIPEAFILKRIDVNETLDLIKKVSSENGYSFDIAELLIFCISRIYNDFKKFFSKIENDLYYRLSDSANIGLTLDVGNGLFVPVIQNSNSLSLKKITEKIIEFKMKALRKNFKSDDFSNCNFSVSLNTEQDTIFVKPIIFPNQLCIISVNSIQKQLTLENNQVKEKSVLMLGLAYDHRLINGSEANQFMLKLKKLIEGEFIKFI